MQVTNVRYSKTVQVQQYEPETIEAVATLDEGESLEQAVGEIRKRVNGLFNGKAGTTESKVTPNKTASERDKPSIKSEDNNSDAPSNPSNGGNKTKAPSKTTKKATGKTKPAKKKTIPYDREVGAHKKAFAQLLHDNYPDWKIDSELGASAKQASLDLVGEDFMDAEGNILPNFAQAVREYMEGGSETEVESEKL